MIGESQDVDLKATFDPTDAKAKLELVKDIVAFANGGGGVIKFGYTETDTPGVARELLEHLDGAKLMDLVNRYVSPGRVRISHYVETPPQTERVGIVVEIDGYHKYPLVINSVGNYAGGRKPVFRPGDIFVREAARSVLVSHQTMMNFIDKAIESAHDNLFRKIGQLARLPPGYEIQYVAPTGDILDDPNALLTNVWARRSRDTSILLNPNELLWCWQNRDQLELSDEQADLLVRSSLRRKPTLFLWLTELQNKDRLELVTSILVSTLEDSDRDKSDAAGAILDVACLISSDDVLETLIEGLRESRYAHLRNAVRDWQGRENHVEYFIEQTRSAQLNGQPLVDLSDSELLALSDTLTSEILEGDRRSHILVMVGRLLFLRASGRLVE